MIQPDAALPTLRSPTRPAVASEAQAATNGAIARPAAALPQAYPRLAYLSPLLPAPSETFVTREIRGLRDRGWPIQTVSLHTPHGGDGLEDLRDDLLVVYGGSTAGLLAGTLGETLRRPIRAAATLGRAVRHALTGEVGGGVRGRLTVPFQAVASLAVAARLRDRGVAHIHCHFAHSSATIGMYAASHLGIPFSFTGHANDLFQRRTLLPEKLRSASFVSCISHWHRDLYESVRPDDAAKYLVIRCGIDTATWLPVQRSRPGGSPFRVVTVCRLVEKKGIDVLVRAMAEFGRLTGQHWELTVVGDGPLRDTLSRIADDLGCGQKIRWLGMLDNARVLGVMDAADVFALPCRADSNGDRDGIPVALMEAMATALPVVAGDLPAVRELVEHEVSGLLADGASVSSVTDQLVRLYRSRELREVLGTGGRQRIEREFGLNANLDRLESALRRSLGIQERSMTPAPRARAYSRRYVIVSPCRDEAKFCRKTLDSVVAQSVPPALWIIVDDGSTDETPAILAEYAAKYPFIKVVRREDRGGRSVGPGVIEAFYHGYDTVNPDDFDYVCKLDLDLILPDRYFEILMERMEANPRLGNCSGKPYFVGPDGELISEGCGDENAIGASKFYRMDCFRQIGGFVRQVMWDGIDGHRCRMLGWIAISWDDPDIRFTHLRPMGSSHKGILTGRMRHGFGQYFMGTGLVYMTASAAFRVLKRPRVIGGAAMWWGYVRSMIKRVPQYGDEHFRRFLRRYQWECLLLGKAAATMRVNQRQASAWQPPSRPAHAAAALAESLLAHGSLGVSLPAAPEVPFVQPARTAGPRVMIAGVAIDNVTRQQALDRIDTLVQQGTPTYVVTPNVDHIVRFQRDEDMREAYHRAALVLADGMPLLWAARFLRTPLKEKVSGSDLFPLACELAARRGYRVFFLGGLPDAAQRASDALRARLPGLAVQTYCPPIGFDRHEAENAAAVARVRDFAPHLLFVGLGAPKQELWIHRHHAALQVPVSIGIGASFDFVSGYVRRAPRVMQKAGFEWAWRLAQEPGRLYHRYLIDDPRFFSLVWKQKRASHAFDHLWAGGPVTLTATAIERGAAPTVGAPSTQ